MVTLFQVGIEPCGFSSYSAPLPPSLFPCRLRVFLPAPWPQPSPPQSGPDPVCRRRRPGPPGSGSSILGAATSFGQGKRSCLESPVCLPEAFSYLVCRGEDLPEGRGPTPGLPRPRGEDTSADPAWGAERSPEWAGQSASPSPCRGGKVTQRRVSQASWKQGPPAPRADAAWVGMEAEAPGAPSHHLQGFLSKWPRDPSLRAETPGPLPTPSRSGQLCQVQKTLEPHHDGTRAPCPVGRGDALGGHLALPSESACPGSPPQEVAMALSSADMTVRALRPGAGVRGDHRVTLEPPAWRTAARPVVPGPQPLGPSSVCPPCLGPWRGPLAPGIGVSGSSLAGHRRSGKRPAPNPRLPRRLPFARCRLAGQDGGSRAGWAGGGPTSQAGAVRDCALPAAQTEGLSPGGAWGWARPPGEKPEAESASPGPREAAGPSQRRLASGPGTALRGRLPTGAAGCRAAEVG